MNKYLLLLIIVLAIAAFFLLKGNLSRSSILIKEKGFFIRTDKTEYTRGETVTIFFINNTATTKQTFLGSKEFGIAKKDGAIWTDVRQDTCWKGPADRVFEPPAPLVYKVQSGSSGKLMWDQKERRCEIIENVQKLKISQVGPGIYKVSTVIGSEDGSNTESVLSNEFQILP